MTIHNPIVINCEGLNRKTGCPDKAQYRPKATSIGVARLEALVEGNWMWNVQTGDLCDKCSNILLAPLMAAE